VAGKVCSAHRRFCNFTDLPSLLRNLADYYERPATSLIHPSEKPSCLPVKKRKYNQLVKLVELENKKIQNKHANYSVHINPVEPTKPSELAQQTTNGFDLVDLVDETTDLPSWPNETQPAQPARPAQPNAPDAPDTPNTPDDSGPSKPAKLSSKSKPAKPAKPAKLIVVPKFPGKKKPSKALLALFERFNIDAFS
jgi:hypothetical protein